MELYVVAGGQMDSLNRWQQDLNSQFLPIYDKDGKPKIIDGVQQFRRLLVAPVQLYKIAFNKENLNDVLAMVHPTSYIEERYSILRNTIKFFRKILGLKTPPKPTFINPFMQPNQVDKAVFVLPIGIKEDKRDDKGEELI